ncbi:hypothetical protein SVIOM74S_10208 [Streptomyces violarus]
MHGYHKQKDEHLKRLRRIEGQIRGLQRMVDEDTYCIDILTQVSASTKALQSFALQLLEEHLRHCVADAALKGGDRGWTRRWRRRRRRSAACCEPEPQPETHRSLSGGIPFLPHAQHLVDALQTEPLLSDRGRDDQLSAQLGEGHVVLNRRTADRSHAHHLISAVTDFLE